MGGRGHWRKAALFPLLAPGGDGFPADAPVVRVHLVDDDHGGRRVLVEDVHQELCGASDQRGLLFRCGAVAGDADVDEGHGGSWDADSQGARSARRRTAGLSPSANRRARAWSSGVAKPMPRRGPARI